MQNTQRGSLQTAPAARAIGDAAAARMEVEQRTALLKISQFIWICFGVLEGMIGLRLFLKLIAANPDNTFAHLVYGMTAPFLAPFLTLQQSPSANGVVLEVPAIVALIVYALVTVLVERLIWLIFSRPKV